MIVHANGLDLRCEVTGPSDAETVVFIHGLAASADIWSGQAERLSDRFRTICYDLRSHGRSQAVVKPCTRSELAGDLIALLDALEIDRAVVVGHSGGGVVAMQSAVEHPERIRALVLVGTASECNDATAKWYLETAEKARQSGGEVRSVKPKSRLLTSVVCRACHGDGSWCTASKVRTAPVSYTHLRAHET